MTSRRQHDADAFDLCGLFLIFLFFSLSFAPCFWAYRSIVSFILVVVAGKNPTNLFSSLDVSFNSSV